MAYLLRLALVAFLTLLAYGCSGALPGTDSTDKESPVTHQADIDAQVVKEANIGMQDDSLIAYLTKHSESDEDLLQSDRLVQQLGDDEAGTRDAASVKLINLGLVALSRLREARTNNDKELARRAQECVERIEKDSDVNLPLAAVRLLVRRKSAGAVKALLRYLPFTIDEVVEEEIYYGLDALAMKDGQVNRLLVQALHDPLPARRAVAGCIVGRSADEKERTLVRKLLDDKDLMVRLRSAQGLLAGKDNEAIPTLIRLLDEPSVAVSWQAEELLHYVAGSQSPDEIIGTGTAESRRECRAAWTNWWEKVGPSLDLISLNPNRHSPGLMFVADGQYRMGTFAVWLCGCDGKPRWQIKDLEQPTDVQFLSSGHILMGEWIDPRRREKDQYSGRVTERDVDGRIVWTRTDDAGAPVACRRLPSGDTLVATVRRLTVIAPARRDRYSYLVDTVCDGRITCASRDARGIVVSTFESASSDQSAVIRDVHVSSRRMIREIRLKDKVSDDHTPRIYRDPLADHYLLMMITGERLLEVDTSGTMLWQQHIPFGWSPLRLRNENTIVICGLKENDHIIEIDIAGKTQWEMTTPKPAQGGYPCFSVLRLGFDARK